MEKNLEENNKKQVIISTNPKKKKRTCPVCNKLRVLSLTSNICSTCSCQNKKKCLVCFEYLPVGSKTICPSCKNNTPLFERILALRKQIQKPKALHWKLKQKIQNGN